MMNGVSLFSSAGIGEFFLEASNIDIKVANELILSRAQLHETLYPECEMVVGDITEKSVFEEIKRLSKINNVDFILASPPCQGISLAGSNRKITEMADDRRNYLITYVIELIKELRPSFILIENVPMLLKLKLYIEDELLTIQEYLQKELGENYTIEYSILDTADYGVPQHRKRAIIKLYTKGKEWPWPKKEEKKVTVQEAIGDLPSLESGEVSLYPWHFARKHVDRQVLWMKHTPTGKSAFENKNFYPQRQNGKRIKGYNSSYRRIRWDKPSPTITIRSDAISSQRNVHPGRKRKDGTYTDARVLTVLELMRLTGLPDEWPIPKGTSEILIRQIIGECIPPRLVQVLTKELSNGKN